MRYETDVLIVGGGPAGLSTAIAVRQHGLKALVVDAARPPIDKACGEGLMPDSLEALSSMGVTLDSLETGPFRGIRFLGDAVSVEAEFPNGVGHGIRRTLLHELLIRRAEDVGTEFAWDTVVDTRSGELRFRRTTPLKPTAGLNGAPIGVKYQWLVGADGHDSRIRKFARLEAGSAHDRRIGLRRHFQVNPWTDLVEIYWGGNSQAYVTPIARDQVCVAVIARQRSTTFEEALGQFPALKKRLQACPVYTTVKGAMTISRTLPAVTSGNVALVGEASGSADAITGEGLAMCFRQAIALAGAIADGELARYEREHRRIMRLPQIMGQAMLLMDKSSLIRDRTLRALARRPWVFDRMLSVHVGAVPVWKFGMNTAAEFGWGMVTG